MANDSVQYYNLRPLLFTKSAVSKDTREYPPRTQRSRANYERRCEQYAGCGYRSATTRPYRELGNVILDDRQLILSGLGQHGWRQDTEVGISSTHLFL